MKAIAQELGISITTVSRGLNGYSDVAEHTRQLIMAAAEARGYRSADQCLQSPFRALPPP
ncbi:MAG: LacI family DNA-binding transcriptional regulator [Spirochaetia bacterium]|nr:LacI family DNA-binding transcriptional regulator [Spirochaetia bacterium]